MKSYISDISKEKFIYCVGN